MKSNFIKAVKEILQEDCYHYIDPRKVGYRIKYPFFTATEEQIKAIQALNPSKVLKQNNIISIIPQRGRYRAFCIWVKIRPSNIKVKR